MELNERKMKILKAVVKDYIETAEAVGSRTISKKHNLGVSAATIRNEMADLEELGYLVQPHTSAGRVPTEKGYKLYVDLLMGTNELNDSDKEIIEKTFIDFYNYISNCVYLKLDLKEHEDFAYDDIDEIKKYFKKDEMLKKMYGPYSNIDSPIMESWNMHTFTNRIISPDKLSIIELNENPNALCIIKNLAEKYSRDNLYYLNEFLSFANEYDNKKSL